jgi:N-methylhydantoinase B
MKCSKGDVAEIVTPGGGGFGPPQARAMEARERDLCEGRMPQPSS